MNSLRQVEAQLEIAAEAIEKAANLPADGLTLAQAARVGTGLLRLRSRVVKHQREVRREVVFFE